MLASYLAFVIARFPCKIITLIIAQLCVYASSYCKEGNGLKEESLNLIIRKSCLLQNVFEFIVR